MTSHIKITGAVQDVDWSDVPTPQTIITSPPYWGKRSYEIAGSWMGGDAECAHSISRPTNLPPTRRVRGDETGMQPIQALQPGEYKGEMGYCECGAWYGQLGQEESPIDFVNHLADILSGLPLRDDGIAWINIGDTYISNSVSNSGLQKAKLFKAKDLAMVPERLALEMHARGWYVRSLVVWAKLNELPEPVRDRPTNKYEKVLMLTRSPRYKYHNDAIVEPIKLATVSVARRGRKTDTKYVKGGSSGQTLNKPRARIPLECGDGLFDDDAVEDAKRERLPSLVRPVRNVWAFATASNHLPHVAPMPHQIAEYAILLSTDAGDYVLDPFAGTGTVMRVAEALGRRSIGVDLDSRFDEFVSEIGNRPAIL